MKIHIRRSKNHSDRYVPLTESIWHLILQYWYSFPPDQRPRDWLFTQQTRLDNPMDLLTLKSYLGHRSLNSTCIYVGLAASYKPGFVNPFDQLGGGTLG